MSTLKKLAGQTAVYGMSSILGRFLNYLLTPLYTYQYIASDYGVVTEMYAYVAFLVVLLTYGMETAFFRFADNSNDPQKVYRTALLPVFTTSIVFMILGLVFSGEVADLIQYPSYPEYISWFAIIVAMDAISAIPLARLRSENKAMQFAVINLSSIALNIFLNLFFIAYCKVRYDAGNTNPLIDLFYNPQIGIGYIFIANLISSALRLVLLFPWFKGLGRGLDFKLLKSMLWYALPLLVVGIAGIANDNLGRLMLKYMLLDEIGLSETMRNVGIYGACYKVSILITLFVQAYRYAAEPFFFSKSGESGAREMYADLMKYFVIVCLFIFLAITLNIETVMLFVGEEYRKGVTVVPILLLANIFLGIYFNLSIWYKLTDQTKIGAYIAIAGALVTLISNALLIPILGYLGSAWSTLFCYFIMTFVSYMLGRKYYHIEYPLLRIGGYFLLVLGLYSVLSNLELEKHMGILVRNGVLVLTAAFIFTLERRKKLII